ncbi:hypothetical protein Lbir_2353 [Legionella birminghamensis]|uniref:Uncharacterized protein n=1 Tax=Legionella birminghamensis TaxID=28083 RepID=A0A378IDC1_9GAMM|nr:hypothetical protein [Legionella birminghamensis]KTC68820.1 hypothetical protein Lbir_2353 [Legionella birminghamensis]STX33238.1 Uncharacterised protein [Legionella birminghamensis]
MSGYTLFGYVFGQGQQQAGTAVQTENNFSNALSLPRFTRPTSPFSASDEGHRKMLTAYTDKFNKALKEYHSLNVFTLVLLSVSAGSYLLSFALSTVLLSVISGFGAGYELKSIGDKQLKYKEALNDLIAVYSWAMGKETGDHSVKLNCPEVRALIMTLGHYVPASTIITWKDEQQEQTSLFTAIKSMFTGDTEPSKERQSLQSFLLYLEHGSHVKTSNYSVYGQGGKGLVRYLWEQIQPELQDVGQSIPGHLKFS